MKVWTRARVLLLVATLVIGAVSGLGVALAGDLAVTGLFAGVSAVVHSLMSVLLPFLGVLWVSDARRERAVSLGSRYRVAMLVAVGVGVFGGLVSAVATALASRHWFTYGDQPPEPWLQAGTVAIGGVVVQLVAQAVGTGFGLLIRQRAVAMIATIAIPLGFYLLLSISPALTPAREWLTPFAAVQRVFSTQMTAFGWLQWLVVIAIWAVGLNLFALARHRSDPAPHAESAASRPGL